LIALKRYRQSIRWQWFFRQLKEEEEKKKRASPRGVTDLQFTFDESEDKENDQGMGSNVKPKERYSSAPTASPEVEAYLKDVERRLIKLVKEDKQKKATAITAEIQELMDILSEEDIVAIPTDKTNSFTAMWAKDYSESMVTELEKDAIVVDASRLVQAHKKAEELHAELEPMLSKNESDAIKESLNSRAVPTPIMLVKDHKDPDEEGKYPKRLVCPATNFVAIFDKIGHKAIKGVLDRNGVVYDSSNIEQASELKATLESLNLQKKEITIVSIDAVRMYPSITLSMVRKAVTHFCGKARISREDKDIIRTGLRMVEFSMGNTLLTFRDQYYEYAGDLRIEDRGLTIGGYGSAFLADLVAAYLMERVTTCFRDAQYNGLYRDDGLTVFNGYMSKTDVINWLDKFQAKVDRALGCDLLQFTAEVWGADRDDGSPSKKVKVQKGEGFPFLDMEMYWVDQDLQFRVHMKENQELKYLNKGSSHTNSCFKAIPHGVMGRLGKLTSRNRETENVRMDILYPKHAAALRLANIAPRKFPTLGKVLDDIEVEANKDKKAEADEKKKDRARQTFFCVGYSPNWSTPIPMILKELRNKHGLKWIRNSMSYHKFSNVRETFQGDAVAKMMKGITSRDFQDLPCNCQERSRMEGACESNSCMKCCVVYSATCNVCDDEYIGCTQNKMKLRMGQHFGEVRKLVNLGDKSDSFADHMAHHFEERGLTAATCRMTKEMVKMKILWQGSIISCMKSFGKRNCKLCMRERLAILNKSEKDPKKMINSKSEIYGGCRHKTNFHRFINSPTEQSTDDAVSAERVTAYGSSNWWVHVPPLEGVIVCPEVSNDPSVIEV